MPFNKKGKLTFENRYAIRNWGDRPKPLQPNANISYDNSQMFRQFVQEVNLEENYNKNGCINAIPIVVYHNFIVDSNHRYLPDQSFTDVSLFSDEMKYLHDNGFKVLKMSDLGYNQSNNYLYIKEPITYHGDKEKNKQALQQNKQMFYNRLFDVNGKTTGLFRMAIHPPHDPDGALQDQLDMIKYIKEKEGYKLIKYSDLLDVYEGKKPMLIKH